MSRRASRTRSRWACVRLVAPKKPELEAAGRRNSGTPQHIQEPRGGGLVIRLERDGSGEVVDPDDGRITSPEGQGVDGRRPGLRGPRPARALDAPQGVVRDDPDPRRRGGRAIPPAVRPWLDGGHDRARSNPPGCRPRSSIERLRGAALRLAGSRGPPALVGPTESARSPMDRAKAAGCERPSRRASVAPTLRPGAAKTPPCAAARQSCS